MINQALLQNQHYCKLESTYKACICKGKAPSSIARIKLLCKYLKHMFMIILIHSTVTSRSGYWKPIMNFMKQIYSSDYNTLTFVEIIHQDSYSFSRVVTPAKASDSRKVSLLLSRWSSSSAGTPALVFNVSGTYWIRFASMSLEKQRSLSIVSV